MNGHRRTTGQRTTGRGTMAGAGGRTATGATIELRGAASRTGTRRVVRWPMRYAAPGTAGRKAGRALATGVSVATSGNCLSPRAAPKRDPV